MRPDYIIITKNPRIRMKALLEKWHAETIIFDATNSRYHLQQWKAECEAAKQAYYSVADEGAFVQDL